LADGLVFREFWRGVHHPGPKAMGAITGRVREKGGKMKTIAVIGPDEAEAKKVAEQLTGVRAVPGAGPGKDIDGVVAVAGEPTVEAVEIVQAVARNIGVVAVLSDHRWP